MSADIGDTNAFCIDLWLGSNLYRSYRHYVLMPLLQQNLAEHGSTRTQEQISHGEYRMHDRSATLEIAVG